MVALAQTVGRRRVLTDRMLKVLAPAAEGKRYIVWDATQPHLGVRVTATGARSFVVVRRLPGERNPTTHVLGSYPALTLKAAREEAPRILAAIVGGRRPREIEAERQRANARKRRDTFAAAVEAFIADEKVKGLRTAGETEQVLRREFLGQACQRVTVERNGVKQRVTQYHDTRDPAWRSRPIVEITRRDVIERLDAIKRRNGKHAARHALGAIRKFFNWCAEGERFGVETSPCANVRDKTIGITGKDLKRRRVLSDDELRDVWHAAEELGSPETRGFPYAPLVRLLVVTGQRLNDIASARWSEIDLDDADDAMLSVPPERYKTGVAHEVPLSPLAVELLRTLPRFPGYVFTTTGGTRPVNGLSKTKRRFDAAIAKRRKGRHADPMPPWVLHDLRRSVRTRLVGDLGVDAFIAERVIGHTLPGLHAVYDVGTHREQKRAALDRWAVKLAAIIEPPAAPAGAVVPAEEVNRRRQSKRR